jgi:hypothetical protein
VDIISFILIVGIIATTIGWGLDWIFSGTVHPIYVQNRIVEEDKDSTITCRVCRHEVKYSMRKMKADGEVKCDKCGSFLAEE